MNQHPQDFSTQPVSPAPRPTASARPRLNRRTLLRELVETVLLIVAIYTLVNLATSRYQVEGESMLPSFLGDEYLIVNRFEYMFSDPQRGDIVIFHYPENPERDFIKRVVGLPGETITMQQGQVFVNGEPLAEPYIDELCSSANCREREWLIGEDEYFVLGDNRNSSQDSTRFGPVGRSFIVGRAWIKYWPSSEWDIIEHHDYIGSGIVPTLVPSPTPPEPGTPEPPMFDSTG